MSKNGVWTEKRKFTKGYIQYEYAYVKDKKKTIYGAIN